MCELGADLSLGFDSGRPMNHDAIRRSTIMGRDLFGPLERCVTGPRPANGVMRKGAWVAPIIEMRHVNRGSVDDPVQSHHLIVGALGSAFRTGSVIANNVNEQGIIQYAHVLQRIHQTSHLFISML